MSSEPIPSGQDYPAWLRASGTLGPSHDALLHLDRGRRCRSLEAPVATTPQLIIALLNLFASISFFFSFSREINIFFLFFLKIKKGIEK